MIRWSFPLLVFTAACDPCAGISACNRPHVDAVGIVFDETGSRAEGVRVTYERTGGVDISAAGIYAETDSLGEFRLQSSAARQGLVSGRLTFVPPPPYQDFPSSVEGVELLAHRAVDTRHLGIWRISAPQIHYAGELHWADTHTRAEGVEVEFRRTGGVLVVPDTFTMVTGADGRFIIRAAAREPGDVIAELVVRPPAPYQPFVISGVSLSIFAVDALRFLSVWLVPVADP